MPSLRAICPGSPFPHCAAFYSGSVYAARQQGCRPMRPALLRGPEARVCFCFCLLLLLFCRVAHLASRDGGGANLVLCRARWPAASSCADALEASPALPASPPLHPPLRLLTASHPPACAPVALCLLSVVRAASVACGVWSACLCRLCLPLGLVVPLSEVAATLLLLLLSSFPLPICLSRAIFLKIKLLRGAQLVMVHHIHAGASTVRSV